jgi:hypothetical protein
MFKSITALRAASEQLLSSFISFRDGGELDAATDVSGGQKKVHEARGVGKRAKTFLELADRYISDPGFNALPPDLQEDMTTLKTEASLVAAELGDAVDPDAIFARLSPEQKAAITDALFVNDSAVLEHAKARLKGQKRGLPAGAAPVGDSKPKK